MGAPVERGAYRVAHQNDFQLMGLIRMIFFPPLLSFVVIIHLQSHPLERTLQKIIKLIYYHGEATRYITCMWSYPNGKQFYKYYNKL